MTVEATNARARRGNIIDQEWLRTRLGVLSKHGAQNDGSVRPN